MVVGIDSPLSYIDFGPIVEPEIVEPENVESVFSRVETPKNFLPSNLQ